MGTEQVRRRRAPPSQQVPGKERGEAPGDTRFPGVSAGTRAGSQSSLQDLDPDLEGLPSQSNPLTRESCTSPPVSVPAPRIPPSAPPASPTLTKSWSKTPGSRTLHVQ